MRSIHFGDKRCTLFIVLFSLMLSACGGSQSPNDLRGKNQNQNDFFSGEEQNPNKRYVTLSGRAVKGVVQFVQVLAYTIDSGQPSKDPFSQSMTEETGEFNIVLEQQYVSSQLALLEASAVSFPPTSMLCDAYTGCGTRDGVTIHYGDSFSLSPGVLMRNVVMLKNGNNSFIGNFSPIRHIAVARAELKTKGLSWPNMVEAESELADLFLFATPVRELTPINLLSVEETDAASDEQVVLAILEASFLNIGVSPEYLPVEEVLSRLTSLGGQFEPHVPGDFYRLSLHNLLRAAYHNIPAQVAHRQGIKAHLLRIIEERAPGLADELNYSSPESTPTASTLQVLSSDGGSVQVLPSGELCATSCEYLFAGGESISVQPVPDDGYEFSHWEAACEGEMDSCNLLMENQQTVSAVFRAIQQEGVLYSLSLNVSGAGKVVELNSSSLCSGVGCYTLLNEGQQMMLVASANEGHQFDGWSGDCSGMARCDLSIDANKTVTAHFSPIFHTLTVSVSEGGSVTSLVADLNCSEGVCSTQVEEGKKLTLSALPSDGYEFESWTGQCTGSGSDCAILIEGSTVIGATFKPADTQDGSILVTWSAPSEREDGTPLPADQILSYTIYYGQTSGVYSGAVTVEGHVDSQVPTSVILHGLETGVFYYLAGITEDTNGVSSQLSNEIIKMAN